MHFDPSIVTTDIIDENNGFNLQNYKTQERGWAENDFSIKQLFVVTMSVADMDSRWKHPFPALVAGPMFCGKSQLV